MPVVYRNEMTPDAMGGTELLGIGLEKRLGEGYLDKFQITLSRLRDMDPNYIQVVWFHDLPGDPESTKIFTNPNVVDRIELFVFVSQWQFEKYKNTYSNLPLDRCIVIPNAINPFAHKRTENDLLSGDKIRLIYHSTPHRGLDILAMAMEILNFQYGLKDKITLDVFSSFELYGWKERDAPYQHVFEYLDNMPNVTLHGTKTNEEVRQYIANSDIFAYPSTWPETSCLCLIEAMAAGLYCVHSDLAALPETSQCLTQMYSNDFQMTRPQHVATFVDHLFRAIDNLDNIRLGLFEPGHDVRMLNAQQNKINYKHSWDMIIPRWKIALDNLL